MRERLYANQISRRKITILDVPLAYRENVMNLLQDIDRERMQKLIDAE